METRFLPIDATKFEDVLSLPHWLLAPRYVFRGQPDATWSLSSTFERAAKGLDPNRRPRLEQTINLEFKRRAHHYLAHLPNADDLLGWLALIRHHGGPARLVDFTRSIYIALFFAVEGAESASALWAVDTSFYQDRQKPPIWEQPVVSTYDAAAEQEATSVLAACAAQNAVNVKAGVVPVEPLYLNERQSIQQGLFLFPKDIRLSFEQNLCSPLNVKSLDDLYKEKGHPAILKITIAHELHDTIAYWLTCMNITATSLFPGLDGFTRGLVAHIRRAKHETKKLHNRVLEAMKNVDNVKLANEVMKNNTK